MSPADTFLRRWPNEDGDLGPRCLCGHYAAEHRDEPIYTYAIVRCLGAYATLAADADDRESVEVNCRCTGFIEAKAGHHLVRT